MWPASQTARIERWAAANDPLDRYMARLTGDLAVTPRELETLDEKVREEVDRATEEAERSPPPDPRDALSGVYAEPSSAPVLWYRGLRG